MKSFEYIYIYEAFEYIYSHLIYIERNYNI